MKEEINNEWGVIGSTGGPPPIRIRINNTKPVEFYHSCGFIGCLFYMMVEGARYHFGDWRSNEEEAVKLATEKLRELGLPIPEKIVFVWDGTL